MQKRVTPAVVVILVVMAALISCRTQAPAQATPSPSADSISAASGQYYYAGSSYDRDAFVAALKAYPYAGSVTVATVNEDGSPNLAVVIPGLSPDGQYLMFGLADNRTAINMKERKLAVVAIYEYAPKAENKADRNRGARVILEYPGDEENERLNAGKDRKSLYMKIIEVIPLG